MWRELLFRFGLASFLFLAVLGCSKSPVPMESQAQTEQTAVPEPTTGSPEDEARAMLTAVLESWVFEESMTTFKTKHAQVFLADDRNMIRPFGRPPVRGFDGDNLTIDLLKYEIGSSRRTKDATDNIYFSFEFRVLLTLQDGQRETFPRNVRYTVSKTKNPDKWHIIAGVKQ